jgi:hypothetical protein
MAVLIALRLADVLGLNWNIPPASQAICVCDKQNYDWLFVGVMFV